MRVGLAKELDRDPRERVTREKGAGEGAYARPHRRAAREPHQSDEQDQALGRRFVELARMAGQRAAAGNTIAHGASLARP